MGSKGQKDLRELRGVGDDFPILANTVPIILFQDGKEPMFANTKYEKYQILMKKKAEGGVLVAVWPGQWSTDVFRVTDETWEKWYLDLIGEGACH